MVPRFIVSDKIRIGIILFTILFKANTNCFCFQDQFQECLSFYEEIYQFMDKEYYKDVSREKFEKFIVKVKSEFNSNKILQDNFKYDNARVLVDWLKDPQDKYSSLYVGGEAKKFETDTFAYEEGLGIAGQLIDKGWKIDWVEPRSDSFKKGLRENDIVVKINDEFVKNLTNEQIIEKLNPKLDEKVKLRIISHQEKREKELGITCTIFDKKTSFLMPTNKPDIFCIQIKLFNKMVLDDLNEIFDKLRYKAISGIILDLRDNIGGVLDFQDNTGGTTYIVENLAGYFIAPGKKLYYIDTKLPGQKEFFSKENSYGGFFYSIPLIGLMNKNTASAAELILGALRIYNKITLIGQNSFGAGCQKNEKTLSEDGKRMALLLVTSLFYLSDGSTFDNKGLEPDYKILDNEQVLSSAVDNLIKQREMNNKRTKGTSKVQY